MDSNYLVVTKTAYESKLDDELSVGRGEVLHVTRKESGRLLVICGIETGWIPEDITVRYNDNPPVVKDKAKPRYTAMALSDFETEQEGYLSFKAGDLFAIYAGAPGGLWLASSGDHSGFVPQNYFTRTYTTVLDGAQPKVKFNLFDTAIPTPLKKIMTEDEYNCVLTPLRKYIEELCQQRVPWLKAFASGFLKGGPKGAAVVGTTGIAFVGIITLVDALSVLTGGIPLALSVAGCAIFAAFDAILDAAAVGGAVGAVAGGIRGVKNVPVQEKREVEEKLKKLSDNINEFLRNRGCEMADLMDSGLDLQEIEWSFGHGYVVFRYRKGVGLQEDFGKSCESLKCANGFLSYIKRVSRENDMTDDDFKVLMTFIEQCIRSAVEKSSFLFPKESIKDNVALAANAFSLLVDVLNNQPLFLCVESFTIFVKRILGALSTTGSLLAVGEDVIFFARRFVWKLLDLIVCGGFSFEGSEELKNFCLMMLDVNKVLDAKKDASLSKLGPDVILSERGQESGFKTGRVYVLKSACSTYLQAGLQWKANVDENKGSLSPSCIWRIETIPHRIGAIALISMYGTYLTSSDDGDVSLVRKKTPGESEYWWPDLAEVGFIVLKNRNNLLLCSNPDDVFTACLAEKRPGFYSSTSWFPVSFREDCISVGEHEWVDYTSTLGSSWCDGCGVCIDENSKLCMCCKCGITVHEDCESLVGNSCISFNDFNGSKPDEKKTDQSQPSPVVVPETESAAAAVIPPAQAAPAAATNPEPQPARQAESSNALSFSSWKEFLNACGVVDADGSKAAFVEKEEVGLDQILDFDDGDLKELGFNTGDRMKIKKFIRAHFPKEQVSWDR